MPSGRKNHGKIYSDMELITVEGNVYPLIQRPNHDARKTDSMESLSRGTPRVDSSAQLDSEVQEPEGIVLSLYKLRLGTLVKQTS